MSLARNIEKCHRCRHRQAICRGPCPCFADEDRRDIIELAQRHLCPLGKFPHRGLGDWVAVLARFTGIKWLATRWARSTGKKCGCSGRQEVLNAIGKT